MSKEMLEQLLVRWEKKPNVLLPCAGSHTTGEVAGWLRASAVAEPERCPACDHVHPRGALCIGIKVGAGGGVVRVPPKDAHPAPAAPVPASVREALTDIDSWRYDTLGQRPRDESVETEVNAAFDRGARMAFYRCSDRARAALASLPAPAAAPPPIMQAAAKAAKTVEGWSDAKRRYANRVTGAPAAAPTREEIADMRPTYVSELARSLALDAFDDLDDEHPEAKTYTLARWFDAILALKAAPAK